MTDIWNHDTAFLFRCKARSHQLQIHASAHLRASFTIARRAGVTTLARTDFLVYYNPLEAILPSFPAVGNPKHPNPTSATTDNQVVP